MSVKIYDSQTHVTVQATWTPDEQLFIPWPLYRGDRAPKSALVASVEITLASDNDTPFRIRYPMHVRARNLNKGGALGATVTTEVWYEGSQDLMPGLAEGIEKLLAMAELERGTR